MKTVHSIFLATIYKELFLDISWDTQRAGFTTFMTILGRYDLRNTKIESCCSVLKQQWNKGFLPNLITTFKNFGIGVS